MLNEFTYCPRLFFLEWVQARFADNTDTVDGRFAHRRVDQPAGAVPLPAEGELKIARSVMLSSERLGLVAKVDLIEGHGDQVIAVETKRGSPPEIPERAWEPERVQLCIQILLLREAGFLCDNGVLYFAESRQRVPVVADDELVGRASELLAELRRTAASDLPPPPLVDSPKCPRCSLVGICLPDETNALAARSEARVRRLVPTRDAARPLYVTEFGAYVGHRKARLEVRKDGEVLASHRMIDISQLSVFGNVQISTQVLRELMARDVPVCWFTYGGWFSGMATGLPGKHVELRRRQVVVSHQGGLEIARRVVEAKIRNARVLLRRNARGDVRSTVESMRSAAVQARDVTSISSLLGIEGLAARVYFGDFVQMLRPDLTLPGEAFDFGGRNRRPPRDAVNCLLSFAYSLLVKDLTATTFAIGFDPYLGFYHRPRFGRPALALDLAEEFRALIAESVVLTVINNGEVGPGDFVVRARGVALTQGGRRSVLRAYERRLDTELTHPRFKYKASYRRVLEIQTRLLAAHLLGEVPEYEPVVTR